MAEQPVSYGLSSRRTIQESLGGMENDINGRTKKKNGQISLY